MNADFHDAHHRHWDDAGQLFAKDRWANADHLYGFAAECGLKCLMLIFGMSFDTVEDRPSNKDDRVHVDKVWVRYESYRSGHHSGTNYPLPTTNPFSNWDASQRYAHQSDFGEPLASSHRDGANQVRKLIKKAQLEGII
jgi:hypothetical protein